MENKAEQGKRQEVARRRFGRAVAEHLSTDPATQKKARERRQKGQDFKRRREQANLKLAEVARQAGVDLNDLLDYETGTLHPEEYPPGFVRRIEKALNALIVA